ncbi:hypothetical protein [Candidatus Vidania fulgoroideorum]
MVNDKRMIQNIKIYTLEEARSKIKNDKNNTNQKRDYCINVYIGSMEERRLESVKDYKKIVIYYGGNNIRYFIKHGYSIINRNNPIKISYSKRTTCHKIDTIKKIERYMALMMCKPAQDGIDLLSYKLMRRVLKANELYYAMYRFHNKFCLLYLIKNFVNDCSI